MMISLKMELQLLIHNCGLLIFNKFNNQALIYLTQI